MKVKIFTEGGSGIGFGHISRCISLAQAFESRGYHVEIVVKGDYTIRDHMQDFPYEQGDWIIDDELLDHHLKDANGAIVDSYLADTDVYQYISKKTKVPLFLDDYKRIDYPTGVVINWSVCAKEMGYPEKRGVKYLLGPKYISLRKAFWHMETKEIRRDVRAVMVSFGGDDSKNMTPRVLEFLNAEYSMLEKYVIIGPAFERVEEINAASDSRTYLIFSPNDEGMLKVMTNCDAAITSGGQTLYELARIGTPAAAVAAAENQIDNVKGWEKAGFVENIGFWSDPELMDRLRVGFRRLMSVVRRADAAEQGRMMVPGNGAGKIVDFFEGEFYR